MSQFRWSKGLVVKAQDLGVLGSNLLGGSMVDSAFHHSKMDGMGTRIFWRLSGKK